MSFIDEIRAELAKRQSAAETAPGDDFKFNFGGDDGAGDAATPVVTDTQATAPATPAAPATPTRFSGADDIDNLCAALEAASEISLDLETTHLTPWSPPRPAGGSVKIGTGQTINQFIAAHPGCTVSERPRARIFAFETDKNFIAAVDLDLLNHDQKIRLIRAAARYDVTWVGHNLSFDLQFLNHLCPGARPGRIIDTMLLTTALKSDVEYDMIRDARPGFYAVEEPDSYLKVLRPLEEALAQRAARASRSASDDAGAVSLNLLSMYYLNEPLDKSFQKPENWMLSHLTDAHLQYCLGDIRAPRLIVRHMLGLTDTAPISTVLSMIDQHAGGTAYKIFEAAVPRLVQMQHNGLRVDHQAAAKYRSEIIDTLAKSVDHLLDLAPSLVPHRTALLDPTQGLTATLKAAVASAFESATGIEIGKTETGDPLLSARDLSIRFNDHEIIKAWQSVQAPAKILAMLDEYVNRCDHESRLHPLVSIATLTGRTSSQEPNLQNMPRAPSFRAIFKARQGYKIIATDFSAVEMRIAACLALRNYSIAVQSKFELPRWIYKSAGDEYRAILNAIKNGTPALPLLPPSWPLPEPDHKNSSIEHYALYYASRHATALARLQAAGCGMRVDLNSMLQDRGKIALSGAFNRGIDPHLLTALQVEVRAGRFEIPGGASPLSYLQCLDPAGRKALKERMKGPRTAAKALNFGLLYGMTASGLHKYGITNYGLSWTAEEAIEARAAWFELYPEIDLWHLMLTISPKNEKRPVRKYGKIVSGAGAKLFRHTTLSSRPVCGPAMRHAANYADQGTGAEIALDAVGRLPEWLAERFVNFVHDEFVFEIEEDRVEQAKIEIEATLNMSADRYFEKYAVASECETEIGDHWIH